MAVMVWQVAGVLAAPVSIHCTLKTLAEASIAACCRAHGPGAVCPMEKARNSREVAGCRLNSASCDEHSPLIAALGTTGVLPAGVPVLTPPTGRVNDRSIELHAQSVLSHPFSPPPRA